MHNQIMRSGQALVIVLLVLAVAATVGLSIASRSVNEINLSTTQDDSSQALSAAESGIDAVLNNPALPTGGATPLPTAPSTTGAAGATYSIASINPYGNTSTGVSFGNSMKSGEYATVFLQTVAADGSFTCPPGLASGPAGSCGEYPNSFGVTACWGQSGLADQSPTGQRPSLEATLYYLDSSGPTVRIKQVGYNSPGLIPARSSGCNGTGNGFCNAGYAGSDGTNPNSPHCNNKKYLAEQTFKYGGSDNIPMSPCLGTCKPIFMRFRMLYNDTIGQPLMALPSDGATLHTFPTQGQTYEVQGTAGQTSRRVQVTQHYPVAPGILDNVLFSGTSL